jgi:hypothetical protein
MFNSVKKKKTPVISIIIDMAIAICRAQYATFRLEYISLKY